MIEKREDSFLELKKIISKEKKIINELTSLVHSGVKVTASSITAQAEALKKQLGEENSKISAILEKIELNRTLASVNSIGGNVQNPGTKKQKESFAKKLEETMRLIREYKISKTEKEVVGRLEKKKKETAKQKEKMKRPHVYTGCD
ncbi:MAG: hypothetical protein M1165_01550, partial [Candidatus Pacearchaeota archaeon]|nr:hypothetical protein [Candidatus Pacearchaeota archaeon]